jgi:HAD superfamily hydrolase (TIGR01549 family)
VNTPIRDVRGVLFDLDGTLYSSVALRRILARRILFELVRSPRAGLQALRAIRAYRTAHEQLRSTPPPEQRDLGEAQLELAVSLSGIERGTVRRCLDRWFEAEALAALRAMRSPETLAILNRLRSRGLLLGVVSDYPARAKLEALGLTGSFGAIVSAQDPGVQRLKPHPAGVYAALELLGVESSEALYVGDRLDVDAGCARAAGLRFVLVGARPADGADDARIRHLGELEALLAPIATS